MTYQLHPLEIAIAKMLDQPAPDSKYQLWQIVTFRSYGTAMSSGQIVGLLYVSPGVAIAEDSEGGWHYTVQVKLELTIAHEDDITSVQQPFTNHE